MNISLWDEVCGADFGDVRLNRRMGLVADELGASPSRSIPSATHSRAEMEAAYRFFDNPKVTSNKILQPHIAATKKRVLATDFVLLVQDTTEVDVTRPSQQVRGAGPMESESRLGGFLHTMHAFGGDGMPLGTVWQKTWTRHFIERELTPEEKKKRRNQTPIEEKESHRWVEGVRAARGFANTCPSTSCVCVCDSEGDIYELFAEPRELDGASERLHLLVRACQTRATTDHTDWLKKAQTTPCLYECTVDVSARTSTFSEATQRRRKRQEPREARIASVEIRATTVALRPPYRPDRKLPEVTLNIVLIEETNLPADIEPIQWLLVTTLPIDTEEQVKLIVQSYCLRWQIEIFFRTIKSGCRIQQRLFETFPRLLNCIAVYMIIAWRIMYLCRLGRECPDLDCEVVFEPSEWKAVYKVVKRCEPPDTPPRLNEMIRLVASLGGFVIRKKNNPGTQTLWLGLQRAHDLSTAWNAFHQRE